MLFINDEDVVSVMKEMRYCFPMFISVALLLFGSITLNHDIISAFKPSKPDNAQTPNPTATQTPNPTATQTPNPTATQTPNPTATQTPNPTATQTPNPNYKLQTTTKLQALPLLKSNPPLLKLQTLF